MISNEKQRFTLGLLLGLKFVLFLPFMVGFVMNYEDINIIWNASDYKSGILKIDSLQGSISSKGGKSTKASGHVNSIKTGILLGSSDSHEVSQLRSEFYQKDSLLLPVWYRSDGQSTFHREENESLFPLKKIWQRVIMNLLFLNSPLIILWIVDWRIKKKYKKNEPKKSNEEFY